MYIGQAVKFLNRLNDNTIIIKNKNNLVIVRVIFKYGLENLSLIILEYINLYFIIYY